MSDKHRNLAIRAATAAYIQEMLSRIIEPIREVAREHGYAVAVHGSLADDIDLLAMPWVEWAEQDLDKVADAIRGAVAGIVGRCNIAGAPGDKPHGRRAYTLLLHPLSYIDLSIAAPAPPPAAA